MKLLVNSELDTISFFAAAFTVIGAFFLVRSILESGAKQIAAMSGTYIGSNPHLEEALAKQKADSLVGFAITFIGGLLWWATVFCSIKTDLVFTNVAGLFLIVLVIAILCFVGSKRVFQSLHLQTRVISFCHHLQAYLRNDGDKLDVVKLIADAKRMGLESLIKDNLDQYENLSNILRRGGANPGADFILELKNKGLDKK